MTGYELVFITLPSLNEEELNGTLQKFKKNLSEYGGELIHEYLWGRRRLAYEIEGNDFGVYHAWYFKGNGKTVDEIQRQFGYSDNVLRNQIVKTNDIDADASFLQNLIPPRDENSETLEVNESQTINNQIEESEKTESLLEKNNAENSEKVDMAKENIEEKDNDNEQANLENEL